MSAGVKLTAAQLAAIRARADLHPPSVGRWDVWDLLGHIDYLTDAANELADRLTGAPCVVDDHDRLIRLLAAADPTYDCICCFFCASSAPHPNPSTGESPAEDHDDDCPWWIARRLLGLPQWPEESR